jgi:hypothetical protein
MISSKGVQKKVQLTLFEHMRDYFLLSDYENERINFNNFLKELLNNKDKKIRKKVFNSIN